MMKMGTLTHKYGWILHHKAPDVIHPDNKEDNYISEEHLKKYSPNFDFVGGRVMQHKGTRSFHHLNQDGTFHTVKGNIEDRTAEPPHIPEGLAQINKYHRFELESLHDNHIQDNGFSRIVSRYTGDSKHINKTVASINKGEGDPFYAERVNNDLDVLKMHEAVKTAPQYEHGFTVFTGLSRSTDPSKAQESSPGKKTAWLPAFTSTSLDELTTRDFSSPKMHNGINQPVHDLMEIRVPARHSGGLYVDKSSSNSGEAEYVLDHGTRVEHDANPKFFVAGSRIFRVWHNGKIVGNKKHDDFNIPEVSDENHMTEHVARLADSQLNTHRLAASKSDKISTAHLEKLSSDPVDNIRMHVAWNPNTPSHTLGRLLKDKNAGVKSAAATNGNLTSEQIHSVLREPFDPTEQHTGWQDAALSNPNIKPEHIQTALKSEHNSVRRKAVEHPLATPEMIKPLVDDPSFSVSRAAKSKLNITEQIIEELMFKALNIGKE